MSVKRIALSLLATIIVLGFSGLAFKETVNTKDNLEFQKVQLQSRQSEIQELNVKYEKLNNDLNNASKQKGNNQSEIKRLEKEKTDLEKQKQDLQTQLQAKLDAKSKLALASDKVVNQATATGTASAVSCGGDVRCIITQAANKYGLSPSYMIGVATCESSLIPDRINYNYYAGGGYPSGLYQFIPSTWARMSAQSGYAGASVFDPVANANTAAWGISHGRASEWDCT